MVATIEVPRNHHFMSRPAVKKPSTPPSLARSRTRHPNVPAVMRKCPRLTPAGAGRQRLVRDTRELLDHGVRSVAIMANDPTDYPEDSFANMQEIAARLDFPFPYLWDESQAVAKDYGAVCTPDFFGYNANLELQYRGRLDPSKKQAAPTDAPRELFEAMKRIAETGQGPREQIPSMGCSIKWRGE